MELTYAKVFPFITVTVAASKQPIVEAWLPVLSAILTARYGDRITSALEPVVFANVGAAVSRRLKPRPFGVRRQSIGGASVEYDPPVSLSWFDAGELGEMDSLLGVGGTRSYRTAAPDAQRFGNMSRTFEED